jgi:uncharacterized membrane protein (DUF106 family)
VKRKRKRISLMQMEMVQVTMWPMMLTMPSDSLVNYFMAHSVFVCKLSM